MNLRENAEERISVYRSKLDIIDRCIVEEMKKVYHRRRNRLLQFLYLEKARHSMALIELEGLLQGATEQEEITIPVIIQNRFIHDITTAENEARITKAAMRTYRIVTFGGIGDSLLITPAIREIKQLYPDSRIYVYCVSKRHKEVLMNNKHIDRLFTLNALARIIVQLIAQIRPLTLQYVDYGSLPPSIFYRKKAAEIIGEMLGVEIGDPQPECFLTEEEEGEARRVVAGHYNPVVIHVRGEATENKNWPIDNWENLVHNNPQYTFLQLGSENDKFVSGAVDLRGNSIREAFGIIKAATAFIGIDSVFAHAAAAFRKPAVILFGASTPVVWGHAGSTNLYNPPGCSPCIDLLAHDPCPYGRACMANIAVSDVERALASLMGQATV